MGVGGALKELTYTELFNIVIHICTEVRETCIYHDWYIALNSYSSALQCLLHI